MPQTIPAATLARRLSAVAVALALSASAAADDEHRTSDHHVDTVRIDVHAALGGYVSLGAGLRVDLPLIGRGLIIGADDELSVSPGVDVFFANLYPGFYDRGVYVVPSVVLQWTFYVGSRWSVSPEAGVAAFVGAPRSLRHDRSFQVAPDVGVAARYHFGRRDALIARVCSPTGLQVGVTF